MLPIILIAVVFIVAFTSGRAILPRLTENQRQSVLYTARLVLCLGFTVLARGNRAFLAPAILFAVWAYPSRPARLPLAG